jgi:hypothetical protein
MMASEPRIGIPLRSLLTPLYTGLSLLLVVRVWPPSPVQAALACSATLDIGPTSRKQLDGAERAVASTDPGSHARRRALVWANLVRAKVVGELAGLRSALRHPATGACVVMASHLLFWALGAGRARVDEDAQPAPVPPPVLNAIVAADVLVFACAMLCALGPTPGLRALAGSLFSIAVAAVCLEVIVKRLRDRGQLGGRS